MKEFKVGDVVRLKKDKADSLKLVIRGVDTTSKIRSYLCVSECGQRIRWAFFDEMELINRPDPQADLMQAIRDVLLSDEFMAKFAAAWMKTPLPLSMQYDNRDGERIKSLTDYPFVEPAKEAPNEPTQKAEPTKAQQLADRTLKAIWQATDGGTQ